MPQHDYKFNNEMDNRKITFGLNEKNQVKRDFKDPLQIPRKASYGSTKYWVVGP
jgi:hypothetical protein